LNYFRRLLTAFALGCLPVLAGCSDSAGGGEQRDRVTGVIDGDTVELERLGRVRLIGVDTPEEGRCYERAATRFTRRRIAGKVVGFELGAEPKDRYGRSLAYISRAGEMHNLELVRAGYAKVLTIPPNDKYASQFARAERGARRNDERVWSGCDRRRLAAKRAARRAALRERRERAARRAGLAPLEAVTWGRVGLDPDRRFALAAWTSPERMTIETGGRPPREGRGEGTH
jgi:micrococcal nuclease